MQSWHVLAAEAVCPRIPAATGVVQVASSKYAFKSARAKGVTTTVLAEMTAPGVVDEKLNVTAFRPDSNASWLKLKCPVHATDLFAAMESTVALVLLAPHNSVLVS